MLPDKTDDQYWRSLDETDPAEQEGGIVVGALLVAGAAIILPAVAWHQLRAWLYRRS